MKLCSDWHSQTRSNGGVAGPGTHAHQTTRAHTVFPRPRRESDHASRTLSTDCRPQADYLLFTRLWTRHLQGFHGDIDLNFVAVVPKKGIKAKLRPLYRDNGIRATRRDIQ